MSKQKRLFPLLLAITAFLSCLVVLGYFSDTWAGELACSFRPYYTAVLAFCALAFALNRMWPFAIATIALLLLNSQSMLPLFQPAPKLAFQNSWMLRVMVVNVDKDNQSYTRLIEYIRASSPEVIAVSELTPAWDDTISSALPQYRYKFTKPGDSYFGIGVYSTLPISKVRVFIPKVNG